MHPSKQEYVEAARGWIGTRWVHQGRTRRGIDCVGLLIVAGADVGIAVPDIPGYRRTPEPKRFVSFIIENSDQQDEIAPGHFGIFRDGNQPCHVGIFAEQNGVTTFIHAYAGRKVVMEEPFIHDWPNRIFAIRSIKGLV